MIECLASLTVGSPLISLALAGGLAEDPFLNGVAIAIDLAAIGDLDTFTAEVDRLGDAITGLPRAAGVDRILLPGERGDAILAEREQNGIPVAAGTWKRLVAAAEGLGGEAPRESPRHCERSEAILLRLVMSPRRRLLRRARRSGLPDLHIIMLISGKPEISALLAMTRLFRAIVRGDRDPARLVASIAPGVVGATLHHSV